MNRIRRLLVANRGEIAVRIFRACREMGIESVAVYSDADAASAHRWAADAAYRLSAPEGVEPYLSIDAVVETALQAEADAVHPGYGFLSENVELVRAVERAGLIFVGPPAETLERLGNKIAARRVARDAGVPTVSGAELPAGARSGTAARALARLGFPLLLKAAAGGGGRGMRRVDAPAELAEALKSAGREAAAAFGDGTIYGERLVRPARHVEVQLMGDQHGALVTLGERECSVQRRHQKLVEESPSPGVSDVLRGELLESARRLAQGVAFHNAATAEFLIDEEGRHYFLELNARLQVEHGVTELVTGLDLVALQIAMASGERLPQAVLSAQPSGHAIQARVYAEDPFDSFRPVPGRVTVWEMPAGPGIRIDAGVGAETELPPQYDPLLAKILVHASDRALSVSRLRRALGETLIGGVQTNLPFLAWLSNDASFVSGNYDTGLIPNRWRDGPPLPNDEAAAAAFAGAEARRGSARDRPGLAADATSEWQRRARAEALRT